MQAVTVFTQHAAVTDRALFPAHSVMGRKMSGFQAEFAFPQTPWSNQAQGCC